MKGRGVGTIYKSIVKSVIHLNILATFSLPLPTVCCKTFASCNFGIPSISNHFSTLSYYNPSPSPHSPSPLHKQGIHLRFCKISSYYFEIDIHCIVKFPILTQNAFDWLWFGCCIFRNSLLQFACIYTGLIFWAIVSFQLLEVE